MTGKFSEIDPERCKHYAAFMSNLSLTQANGIFWTLFGTVLLLLCIASLQHHRSLGLSDVEKGLSIEEKQLPRRHRRVRRLRVHYLSIASLCLVLSCACTVFEVYCLFNIEYCDGEDLINLYWSFWSILQVGSNIAIFGVMLQLWIVLGNVQTPSWAVALGTPVLVFAALGWVFREIGKQALKRIFRREIEDDRDDDNEDSEREGTWGLDNWLSRTPTIVPESKRRSGSLGGSPRRASTA